MEAYMRAAVLEKYGSFTWASRPIPKIENDQVLIKVHWAGICGSDQHIFKGDFHPRTRVPLIPGHEFAGTVVATGDQVKNARVGDRVAVDPIIPCGKCGGCQVGHWSACTSLKLLGVDMDGGFAEYVAARENMLYKLDERISDRQAALVEIFSIGFHANNRAGTRPGDVLAIWGAGRVGQVILQAARTLTDNVIFMIDIIDKRLEIARSSIANVITINAMQEDPIAVIMEHTRGRGVDIAFEAVGHEKPVPRRPHPVRGCIQSIKGGGVVCVLGLADDPAPIILKELIWREGRIIASRVSHGEFSAAIANMAEGRINPEIMVSAEFDASQAQHAFEVLNANPEHYMKILLRLGD
jgi:threonine dehydrogenase-like Zn-dependent dehydrogenase